MRNAVQPALPLLDGLHCMMLVGEFMYLVHIREDDDKTMLQIILISIPTELISRVQHHVFNSLGCVMWSPHLLLIV